MSKVAIISFPFFSHVFPSLDMVEELMARGEEVVYYSDESMRELVEQRGIPFRSYGNARQLFGENKGTATFANPRELLSFTIPGVLERSKTILNSIMKQVLADDPDYLLRDCDAHWGKQLAQILEIPVISFHTTIALNEEIIERHPTFVLETVFQIPGESLVGGEHGSALRTLNEMSTKISQQYGVEEFHVLEAFTGFEELNIVFTTEEVQPFAELFDDSYQFIGPMLRKSSESFPVPKSEGKPVIYIAFGSIFTNCLEFYQMCIEAFREPDCHVILSTGNRVHPDELGEVPEHIIVKSFVPQIDILRQADVFISHAGYNSVSESLSNGVPLIMCPQAADQFAVATRIEELGAGIYLRDQSIAPDKLKELAFAVYHNQSMRQQATWLGESFGRAGGVKQAADAILKYVEESEIYA